jgi:superfamily I DNA/RNA helicase
VSVAALPDAVLEAVLADRAVDAGSTLAVIAPEPLMAELHDRLESGLTEPVGYGADGLRNRISVLPSRVAKGLEFDAVVVVDHERIAREDGSGSLYVALTRPTQRLALVDPD